MIKQFVLVFALLGSSCYATAEEAKSLSNLSRALIARDDEWTRAANIIEIAKLRPIQFEALAIVVGGLHDQSDVVRQHSLKAIQSMDTKGHEALVHVVRLVGDKNSEIADEAVVYLLQLKGLGLFHLENMLFESVDARIRSAYLVGELGKEDKLDMDFLADAERCLRRSLQDRDASVKIAALKAVSKWAMRGSVFVKHVSRLTTDTDNNVSKLAKQVLDEIAPLSDDQPLDVQ